LHDIAWGTKGGNGAVKALGSAKTVKDSEGKEVMELDLPTTKFAKRMWTMFGQPVETFYGRNPLKFSKS
jgi:hypothetical protein